MTQHIERVTVNTDMVARVQVDDKTVRPLDTNDRGELAKMFYRLVITDHYPDGGQDVTNVYFESAADRDDWKAKFIRHAKEGSEVRHIVAYPFYKDADVIKDNEPSKTKEVIIDQPEPPKQPPLNG